MAQGLDPQMVAEYYAGIPDAELTRILTQDAVGMTAEAKEIATREARKRGFSEAVIGGIEAQHQVFLPSEIDDLCLRVRKLQCPKCGKSDSLLNVTVLHEVFSMIILTNRSKRLLIACPECLRKANTSALVKSALLGWWGLPWGLIRTPQAIFNNLRNRKSVDSEEASEPLRAFITQNAALFQAYKNDPVALKASIRFKD